MRFAYNSRTMKPKRHHLEKLWNQASIKLRGQRTKWTFSKHITYIRHETNYFLFMWLHFEKKNGAGRFKIVAKISSILISHFHSYMITISTSKKSFVGCFALVVSSFFRFVLFTKHKFSWFDREMRTIHKRYESIKHSQNFSPIYVCKLNM